MFYVVCKDQKCRIYSHFQSVQEDEKEGFKLVGTKNTINEAKKFITNELKKEISQRDIKPKK